MAIRQRRDGLRRWSFIRAYREAALHRCVNWATRRTRRSTRRGLRRFEEGAQEYLLDTSTRTFGPRWQTNAAAVIGGAARPDQYDAIWKNVLSQVGTRGTKNLIISPYYNYYVIRAMAEMGHRDAGTEVDSPASTGAGWWTRARRAFWEAYDPELVSRRLPLVATKKSDNRSGYFVSLAHGWSSGPTAWMMEQVLGIQPTGAGFSTVDIRPDLVDLELGEGRGAELRMDCCRSICGRMGGAVLITVDVPEGVVARACPCRWLQPATRVCLGQWRPGDFDFRRQNGTRAVRRRSIMRVTTGWWASSGLFICEKIRSL